MSELLGADTEVLDRRAESLTRNSRSVQDLRILVQRVVEQLQASWNGPDLAGLTQQWEQQASPLLAAASAALDTCAAQLLAQSGAQRATSSDGTIAHLPLSVTSPPPSQWSPAQNARWWRSLGPQEQQEVIREHPDWVGSLDGIAFTARDQANQSLLVTEHERLVAEEKRLEGSLAGRRSGDSGSTDLADLRQVKDKLASLAAIDATLATPGEHHLLVLDTAPPRAEAAISNGNVETADNVAVFVPGMTTTVSESMGGNNEEMGRLQQRAQEESTGARAATAAWGATAATVTWIGYQAPQMGSDLLSANSVVGSHSARAGAAKLVPFLQGIGAARERDAHLTLLGHSYGSTTAGLALRQNTGVDDVVFFGSPGLGTDHVEDLKVAPGHTHYIEAQQDLVGDFGRFGEDPSLIAGIDHPSALESTVKDPVTGAVRHFEGVTGHSSYLLDKSTSQYNLSVIVDGMPEREVRSDGVDVGDVLRWVAGVSLPTVPGVNELRTAAALL